MAAYKVPEFIHDYLITNGFIQNGEKRYFKSIAPSIQTLWFTTFDFVHYSLEVIAKVGTPQEIIFNCYEIFTIDDLKYLTMATPFSKCYFLQNINADIKSVI